MIIQQSVDASTVTTVIALWIIVEVFVDGGYNTWRPLANERLIAGAVQNSLLLISIELNIATSILTPKKHHDKAIKA